MAYLVDRLANTPEPGGPGSLLDNTLIVWTNELGKGNSHTLDDIPFVLVGGGLDFRWAVRSSIRSCRTIGCCCRSRTALATDHEVRQSGLLRRRRVAGLDLNRPPALRGKGVRLAGREAMLSIVYRDDRLLALDKPSGLLAVPGRGPDLQDCLARRAQALFPTAIVVHRLDRDTSGLMLMALDAEAQRELSRQFAERLVERAVYAAVAWGAARRGREADRLSDAQGFRRSAAT